MMTNDTIIIKAPEFFDQCEVGEITLSNNASIKYRVSFLNELGDTPHYEIEIYWFDSDGNRLASEDITRRDKGMFILNNQMFNLK